MSGKYLKSSSKIKQCNALHSSNNAEEKKTNVTKRLLNICAKNGKPEIKVNLSHVIEKPLANQLINKQNSLLKIKNQSNDTNIVDSTCTNNDSDSDKHQNESSPAKRLKLTEHIDKSTNNSLIKVKSLKVLRFDKSENTSEKNVPVPSILRKTKTLLPKDKIIMNMKSVQSIPQLDKNNNVSVSIQTDKHPLLSIEYIKDNDKAIDYYTGLQNYKNFVYVFKTLGPDAYNLVYYFPDEPVPLSQMDQLFMTLILLRQQKTHYELCILFDITLKDIKNIFITWIKFMSLEWEKINLPKCYVPDLSLQNTQNTKSDSKNDCKSDADVVTLENDQNSITESIKKKYKILSGPNNYIESHLMKYITIVCHVLVYLKVSCNTKKQAPKSL